MPTPTTLASRGDCRRLPAMSFACILAMAIQVSGVSRLHSCTYDLAAGLGWYVDFVAACC
jgi:hypothetical protein